MKYKKLITELETFLKDCSATVTEDDYNEEAGYPKEDAMFDEILFIQFEKHLDNVGLLDLWNEMNEELDYDTKESTDAWNTICELVRAKIAELLR